MNNIIIYMFTNHFLCIIVIYFVHPSSRENGFPPHSLAKDAATASRTFYR